MSCIHCDNKVVENPDTRLCATCGKDDRKAEKARLKPKKEFKPIRKQSKKMGAKMKEYGPLKAAHLKAFPECQIKLVGCTKEATDLHHSEPRATGLLKKESFKSACRHCHRLLHDKLSAPERREKDFLK